MNCHDESPDRELPGDAPIILIGNPNVGKSMIFGRLTGRYVTVSNYPGTTVEITQGRLPDGTPLIDTPGTNTLTGNSDDERITHDVLRTRKDAVRAVVQVADARNLQRALLLTRQLTELGVPLVLDLNMIDEARSNGLVIDRAALAERLGIPVVSTVATTGEGLPQLMDAIHHAQTAPPAPAMTMQQQLTAAQSLARDVTQETSLRQNHIWQTISRLTTDPVWGWPILILILFVIYKFVGELGAGTLVGFMEEVVFGEWINPLATRFIDQVMPNVFIHDLLVGQYGVITMALSYGLAIVLPIVFTFFIAFSILEDTGYLPRLAVMLNRLFKQMGVNGKAVLPMVLGLGCDTMATMTTRILETRKERLMVTLLLALGVPCSAQLGVILGMLGGLHTGGVLIWAGVLILTMLTVGLLAAKLLTGESGDFILELPPLRLPHLNNILIKTLARMEWYLKEVLPLFVLGTLLLFVLDQTGALSWIEQLAAPLVSDVLGLPKAAAGAFLIGFLRRDYGAAGLFALALDGQMNSTQILVSLIVITLFIPCIANVLIIVKEYGAKIALGVSLVVFPLAFAIGALVNFGLRVLQITP